MGYWYDEEYEGKTRYGMKVRSVLFEGRSPFQKVEIVDSIHYGPTLVIDGVFMTSEREEHFYHEMLVQPAMTTAPRIGRVLIVGGGDGGTARETLRHEEVESVTLVEIDEMVVEACRAHMPTLGLPKDDRLEVVIGDGIDYAARAAEGSYDVVFLDGCDPVGPSEGLFNVEFYRSCRRLLTPDGVFAAQTASPILLEDLFLATVRALREVFPKVVTCFGPAPLYASDQWSWTLCSNDLDHLAVDDARARRVEEVSKYWNREIHAGAFALSNELKKTLG